MGDHGMSESIADEQEREKNERINAVRNLCSRIDILENQIEEVAVDLGDKRQALVQLQKQLRNLIP